VLHAALASAFVHLKYKPSVTKLITV
jgi:hypothetical protein